ncbi:MAG: hypothetical protein JXA87_09105 [Thermoleophilia bacterium]|nr:hypothetical protein [Thermoleophilia bacterium]
MGLMDKLSAGVERLAEGADKAIDKGKAKVGELQIEMQMDGLAKKLGYFVFDFYRGRQVDQALRQKILDDMARLEDQLLKARAEAAARAQAERGAAAPAAAPAPPAPQPPPAQETAPAPDAAAGTAAEVWPDGEDTPSAGA